MWLGYVMAIDQPERQPGRLPEPDDRSCFSLRVDDFDRSLTRARKLVDRLTEAPHGNPNTRTNEFSLRDPDGYYVTISALPTGS